MISNSDYNQHYTGVFKVHNEEMMGNLVYNRQAGLIALNLKRKYGTSDIQEESFSHIDAITGKLNSGAIVSLLNTQCVSNKTIVPSYHEYQFLSSIMIWSNEELTEPKFNRFVFKLENALEWSGLTSFDEDFYEGLKILSENPERKVCWFDAEITFRPSLNNWNHYPRKEDITISQRLEVTVDAKGKRSLDYFISIRDKIISLIAFAIKGNVNIDEQYGVDYDKFHAYRENKKYVKHYVLSNEPLRRAGTTHKYHYNFRLNSLDDARDNDEIMTKLSPVLNLYLSLFKYNDMPVEMIFLNIVQALETFHSRFYYNNNVKDYVRSVREKYEKSPNYNQIKELLLRGNQENCQYIYLVSRINDLLFNSRVRLFLNYCSGNKKDFAQKIVDTRNYYTHYDRGKEQIALSGSDLSEAIYILRLLLEYNICLVLGIDNKDKVQDELINFRTWKTVSRYQSNTN